MEHTTGSCTRGIVIYQVHGSPGMFWGKFLGYRERDIAEDSGIENFGLWFENILGDCGEQLWHILLFRSTLERFCPQRYFGQAVVTGVVPSRPRYMPPMVIAHRVQHSHSSSIFIECCLLTLSRFPLIIFLCQKKFLRVCALGENSTREIDFSRHEYPRVNGRDC